MQRTYKQAKNLLSGQILLTDYFISQSYCHLC